MSTFAEEELFLSTFQGAHSCEGAHVYVCASWWIPDAFDRGEPNATGRTLRPYRSGPGAHLSRGGVSRKLFRPLATSEGIPAVPCRQWREIVEPLACIFECAPGLRIRGHIQHLIRCNLTPASPGEWPSPSIE